MCMRSPKARVSWRNAAAAAEEEEEEEMMM
jgi:hypothetical protein